MKFYLYSLLIYILVFKTNFYYTQQKADIAGSNDYYRLVWSDEFNISGKPDSSNWKFENGFVRNHELQWYQQDNAMCDSGRLIIEARREQKVNPEYIPGSEDWRKNREYATYTSSSLLTRGLHSWQFGRFEMRARIDTRQGLWPAFWTLGMEGRWPHNGEMDIMEYYNNKILANFAWGAREKWKPIWNSTSISLDTLKLKDNHWDKKFHIWRMDWDQESIRLYLDGRLLNKTDIRNTYNRDNEARNPFLQPHYIIINLAVGGSSGGDPSPTKFPAYYEIDYIRVYQKQ